MLKKAILTGVLGVYSLCALSPLSLAVAGAEDNETYFGGVYANSTITGDHSLYLNNTTQVAGLCGVYSAINSTVGHSIQPIGVTGSTTDQYVRERLYTDYSYSISNYIGVWKSLQVDSFCYVALPAVVDYLGGSFGVYNYTITVDNAPANAGARVDILLNILDINTGYTEQYSYTGAKSLINGIADIQIELDLSGIQSRSPSVYLVNCTTILSCTAVDNNPLYFRWTIEGGKAIPVRPGYAYEYYLPANVQLSSFLSPIFATVSNFFKIEILPNFHIYDILMFGVVCTVLGFAMKLFLGG